MTTFSSEWLSTQMVSESREAIIFSDADGIIRLWNRGAEEISVIPPPRRPVRAST